MRPSHTRQAEEDQSDQAGEAVQVPPDLEGLRRICVDQPMTAGGDRGSPHHTVHPIHGGRFAGRSPAPQPGGSTSAKTTSPGESRVASSSGPSGSGVAKNDLIVEDTPGFWPERKGPIAIMSSRVTEARLSGLKTGRDGALVRYRVRACPVPPGRRETGLRRYKQLKADRLRFIEEFLVQHDRV